MHAKSTFRSSLIACVFAAAFASGAVMAQSSGDPTVPGHPRVNEVNKRLDNQQGRTQAGVAKGQVNARQEARDEKHDANIAQRAGIDEARHHGHLTRREHRNLNRAENRNSRRIRKQRHG
jgi:hypothetical protein